MRFTESLLGVALLSAALAGESSGAPAPERLTEVLAALKSAGESLQTLAARFRQTKHDHILSEDSVVTGRLYYQVPGRIRWEYDPPDGKVLLVREDKVQVYNPAARQVQEFPKGRLKAAEGELLIGLGPGNAAIGKRYQVSLLGEDADRVTLKLVPRGEALFTGIELSLDSARFLPVRTVFQEPNRDTTELVFSQKEVNRALPRQIFELKLPAGVEVIRGQ